jgi:hypothetical protein
MVRLFKYYFHLSQHGITHDPALEGELVITSRLTSKGYLNYDNSSFTIHDGNLVTFRTGDIYGYVDVHQLGWKGRKEDYIQVWCHTICVPKTIFFKKTLSFI